MARMGILRRPTAYEFAMMIDGATQQPGTFRLDAVQGSQDERVSRTDSTVNEQETPADAVMRQELGQAAVLGSEAGQSDGGVW